MSSQLTSRVWQTGLLALGLGVACGASTSRHEPGGTERTPTAGGIAEAGAVSRAGSGGEEASSGGASGSGGVTPAFGGGAEVAGAPSSGTGSVVGGRGGAGSAGGGGGAGPVHDRCADPWPLEFVDGVATVSDDTSRATDEFPALVCDRSDPQVGFQGGQIYYRFTARPGREYALSLKAADYSSADFYVFPAATSCTTEAIRAACSSHGETGAIRRNIPLNALTPFAPREPGDYIIGVDTTDKRMGEPFTLTVFEYCGTSGATDCKVKGCDLSVWRTCLGNTISACNDDGTATVTTDCTTTNKSCDNGGFCVESVTDLIGNTWPTSPAMNASADGVALLDFYEVTTSRTITELEMTMVQQSTVSIDWLILESMDRAGPYQTIFTKRTRSGGSMSASGETTGPIQVPIVAGRFYAMGVALPAGARYYLQLQDEKSLPVDVYFGRLTSAGVVHSASTSAAIGYPAPDNFVIAQEIRTKL